MLNSKTRKSRHLEFDGFTCILIQYLPGVLTKRKETQIPFCKTDSGLNINILSSKQMARLTRPGTHATPCSANILRPTSPEISHGAVTTYKQKTLRKNVHQTQVQPSDCPVVLTLPGADASFAKGAEPPDITGLHTPQRWG